jgi:hypothetical protein
VGCNGTKAWSASISALVAHSCARPCVWKRSVYRVDSPDAQDNDVGHGRNCTQGLEGRNTQRAHMSSGHCVMRYPSQAHPSRHAWMHRRVITSCLECQYSSANSRNRKETYPAFHMVHEAHQSLSLVASANLQPQYALCVLFPVTLICSKSIAQRVYLALGPKT